MEIFKNLMLAKRIFDFEKRLNFYCLGNNVKDSDEAQQNGRKALFPTLVGQTTFTKLRHIGGRRRGPGEAMAPLKF